MDAARQDPVAAIESALARLRIAQRHGPGPRAPRGPFGAGPFAPGPMGPGPFEHHDDHGHDAHHDGPGPHDLHERPDPFARGHGHHGGPHARGLGAALGAARFRMLERLVEGSASVSELADAIGVDQPRASRLVADAARRGLVERTPDPTDARRALVSLTTAGRDLLTTMRDTRRSAVTTALEGFTDEETATFAALLDRFVSAWPAR